DRGVMLEPKGRRDEEVVRDARAGDDVPVGVGGDRLHRRRAEADPDRELGHGGRHYVSDAITASCSRPLVHTNPPASTSARPSTALQRPPASSTIGISAAMSQTETIGSIDTSNAPSATSRCCQKSPIPRVRQQRCDRSTSLLPTPPAWKRSAVSQANENWASSSAATEETERRSPSRNAPSPRPAHHRMPSAGADATPTISSPAYSTPISVAQMGTPRT